MTAKKPMAKSVNAFIDPPGMPWFGLNDPELLREWVEFRSSMDAVEVELNASQPKWDWHDAVQKFRAEADAAFRKLRGQS